jgi:hypothetical protein
MRSELPKLMGKAGGFFHDVLKGVDGLAAKDGLLDRRPLKEDCGGKVLDG